MRNRQGNAFEMIDDVYPIRYLSQRQLPGSRCQTFVLVTQTSLFFCAVDRGFFTGPGSRMSKLLLS